MLIVSITGRIAVFLFMFSLFIFLLFIQGNFQSFIDISLINLMLIYRICAILYVIASISYVLILLMSASESGKRLTRKIATSIIGIVLAAVGYIIITILTAVLQPVI